MRGASGAQHLSRFVLAIQGVQNFNPLQNLIRRIFGHGHRFEFAFEIRAVFAKLL